MSNQTGVYIKDDEHGWIPATIVSYNDNGDQATVSIDSIFSTTTDAEATTTTRVVHLNQYEDNTLPLQNVNVNGDPIIISDMCDLPSLHEAAILYNLKSRHEDLKPYTKVGDIIIAMNPFMWINDLYSKEVGDLYVEKYIQSNDNNRSGSNSGRELEPHVYEVSSLAYKGLALDSKDQSILVSGESGAGKTETVKIVMSHLASIHDNTLRMMNKDQQNHNLINDNVQDTMHADDNNIVVKKVLDSNPLLEAFGNAQTVRNDNSSRFGKYIQLQFDVQDTTTASYQGKKLPSCVLAGSICETYLLEKSRVVGHEELERTYHIFYQLLSATDEVKCEIWDGLRNTTNASFKYVGETSTTTIENKTDYEKWQNTIEALTLIGVKGDVFKDLMRAICITMQLGNIIFTVDPSNDDGAVISSKEELSKLSALMGVDEQSIEKALTFRTIHAPKESYSVPLRVNSAKDSCDALAKEIYQQSFDWLVRSINDATCAEKNYDDDSNVEQYGQISLLDIFGFESFKINRFEQFCINYANEKLQSKYNLDIFSSVQEEYNIEGIPIPDVTFDDNSVVINLIEGRMGLVSMLNEECLRPHGNDASFVSKMKKVNQDIDALVQNPLHTQTQFSIMHYAAEVTYEAANFVQKNMDILPQDLIDCVGKSNNIIIKDFVKSTHQESSCSKERSKLSVCSKFRTHLKSLMSSIGETKTRYIRCIKPNPERIPKKVDLSSSLEQLRCAGVVAAVTISRVSYPNRLTHEACIDKFCCLFEDQPTGKHPKSVVTEMIPKLLIDYETNTTHDQDKVKAFEVGTTRIYFRAGTLEYLESKRLAKLEELAIKLQRIVRGYIAWSKYSLLKAATIKAQSLVRRNNARRNLLQACKAVTKLSCWVRCIFAKAILLRLKQKKACTLVQTRFRIHVAQKNFVRSRAASILLQKIWRGALQRPIYRVMLEEAKEEARVNSKLAALQKRLADAEMRLIMSDKARMEAEKRVAGPFIEEKKSDDHDDQKALLDESTKMLDYLKQQVFEFRGKNFLLRNDLHELKVAHNHLAEQYSALTSSYEALRQHSTNLSKTNKQLVGTVSSGKKELYETKKELKLSIFEHKVELRKLTEQMKVKEQESAKIIQQLQAELSTLRIATQKKDNKNSNKNGSKTNSYSNTIKRRKGQSRKPPKAVESQTQQETKKKQVNLDRKNKSKVSSAHSIEDERWLHDKYQCEYSMEDDPRHSASSTKISNVDKDSVVSVMKKNNAKQTGRSKNPSSDEKKPTISKSTKLRDRSTNQDITSMSRNKSLSSLKEEVKIKKDNEVTVKMSSLAKAASRKSLVEVEKNKKLRNI